MMDLAFEAEMDYRQIGRIERGETNFTIGTLMRIAVVLDVSLKDLMKWINFWVGVDKNRKKY